MVTLAPNATGIIYSPGNWSVSATEARTNTPGAYLRFLTTADTATISLTFDMAGITLAPVLAYRVDDGPWTRVAVAATVALTMTSAAWERHLVEVVYDTTGETLTDRWTGAGDVALTGITIDSGGFETITERAIKGVVFGDSITEGRRTVAVTSTDAAHSTLQCYAWNLNNHMSAEVGVVGYGSTGYCQPAVVNGNVPAAPGYVTTMWDSGPARDLTGLDFVVVNLGTNDSATYDDATLTAAVATTLDLILGAVDATTHLVALRPFRGTARQAQIEDGIAACSAPSRVTFVDTAGWWYPSFSDANDDGVHPFGNYHRAVLAPNVAAAILDVLANPISSGDRYVRTRSGWVGI